MSVLTAANQVTLVRMLLVPAFVILVVYGHLGWALLVFMLAGLTDLLDGLIARWSGSAEHPRRVARSHGRQAAGGEHLRRADHPGLGLANRLPIWLTVMIIMRDVVIVATVAIVNLAVGRRTFRPSIFGKIATATYMMTVVVAMFFNYLGYHSVIVDAFVWASLAITLDFQPALHSPRVAHHRHAPAS